jgi:hypothetical protein
MATRHKRGTRIGSKFRSRLRNRFGRAGPWLLPSVIAVAFLLLAFLAAFARDEAGGRLKSAWAELERSFALAPAAFAKSGGDGGGNGGADGGENGNGRGNGNGGGDNKGHGNGNGGADNNGHGNGSGDGSDNGNGNENDGAGAGASTPGGGAAAATRPASGSAGAVFGQAGGGGRGEFLASEIVVVDDKPGTRGRALGLGFTVIDQRRLRALELSVLRLKPPPGMSPLLALTALRRAMPRLTADLETLYQPYATQGVQAATQLLSLPAADYAQRMIDWPQDATCGRGIRLGMIDTAVAGDLPALVGRKLHLKSFVAGDVSAATAAHGTAIASLLVGRGASGHPRWRGLLPDADLYAASIFERHGTRLAASAIAIAAAIDWLAGRHVPVVNVSVSGAQNALVALAVRRAAMRGTVLVAAAGNGGPEAAPAYPAAYSEVIAVTAVDQHGAVFPGANRGPYIAFAAPGVRIWTPAESAFGQYETGTSFAAPFLAATVALEIAASGRADPSVLKQRLARHSLHLGPPGRNPIYGYGLARVNAGCEPATAAAP